MNNKLIDMTNARDVEGISRHLKPMILSVCNRYNRKNIGNYFDDLKQECLIAILTVIDKFDKNKSMKIHQLYKWAFETACRDFIFRSTGRTRFAHRKSRTDVKRKEIYFNDIDELVDGTNGTGYTLGDTIEDDTFNIPGYGLDYSDLHNTLNILSDKDKLIIYLKYGLDGDKPLVTRDIARIVKISAPSIKWSLQRSFKRLKDYL